MNASADRTVTVGAERLGGWIDRFAERHGDLTWEPVDDAARARATDGATATIRLAGPQPQTLDRSGMAAAALGFDTFGLVLVRRGGFAVGRVEEGQLVASRTGTRYVQGQTKAGGQSQKRFARRRANQAAGLARAAADAVDHVLGGWSGPVVAGGDRALVSQVLNAARHGTVLADRLVPRWLDIGNPRRRVLEESMDAARAARITLNALA
jgi:VLRF1 release factor-like protein